MRRRARLAHAAACPEAASSTQDSVLVYETTAPRSEHPIDAGRRARIGRRARFV